MNEAGLRAGKAPFALLKARLDPAWLRSCVAAAQAWVLSRALVYAGVIVAPLVLPERVYTDLPPEVPFHTKAPPLLDALVRWDAFHYLSVVTDGYRVGPSSWLTNTPSLPLYPWLMFTLGGIAGEVGMVAAGTLVSHVSFFAALVLLHRLTDEDVGPDVAGRTVLYLAVFPTSMFFSALYAEALFVALLAACFLALRRRRWLLAGLAGALAAMTRAPGVLLTVVMLWEWQRAYGVNVKLGWRALLAAALVPLGTAVVCVVQWQSVGDPLSFVNTQPLWGRRYGTPLDQLEGVFTILRFGSGPGVVGFAVLTLVLLFFVIAGIRVLRAQRSAHAVWYLTYLLVALSAPGELPFLSALRFLLAAFPGFIVLAELGANRLLHWLYMVTAGGWLVIASMVFTQWYWVA